MLRCFCALAETKSFRLAAERVHRSQPAISQQMRTLERETGHVLVDRRTGRVTPAGQLLYDRARQILLAVDGLQRELSEFDDQAAKELRVGTSDTTALYVLPPYVRRFRSAHPRTRLVLVNRSSDAIAEQVLRGDLELGIVTLPHARRGLDEEELFRQRLVLVTPPDHRLAGRREAVLSDLRDEPLLLLHESTRTGALLRKHFAAQGFIPQVALDSGSFEVIKRYIAEGIGVSFLPEAVAGRGKTPYTVIEVPGLPEIPIGAIWRSGAYRSKAVQAFLELLRAQGKQPARRKAGGSDAR